MLETLSTRIYHPLISTLTVSIKVGSTKLVDLLPFDSEGLCFITPELNDRYESIDSNRLGVAPTHD